MVRLRDNLNTWLAFVSMLDASTSAQPLITGYWPDWVATALPPESIDMTKYDIINFSFGIPTTAFDITFNSASSTDALQRLVAASVAANTGTRIVLSIGGWLSSAPFSAAVATEASRTTFAQNMNRVMQQYRLDGVDIDWEYPGSVGAGNPYPPSDAAHFQLFLGTLRSTLGPDAIITVTTSHEPWDGPDGLPIADVSPAAAAVDAVLIMNYDVNQGVAGVNAPLADLCGNSTQPRANAAAAVKQWMAAGMPKEKILLGVPAYGYVQASASTTLPQRRAEVQKASRELPPRIARFRPRYNDTRTQEDEQRRDVDPLTHISTPGELSSGSVMDLTAAGYALSHRTQQLKRQVSDSGGQINFNSLISQGILVPGSDAGSFIAGPQSGYTKYWDSCSDTPFLANGQQMISYDDPQSLKDKAAFALQAGLTGVGVWSIEADTSGGALRNALAQGLGRA